MIKRTIYIGNPSRLTHAHHQLMISQDGGEAHVPIEDIGILMLDHPQITLTHRVIQALQENESAIISCDEKHLPFALMVPFEGHHVQAERMRVQWDASLPLKKQLWKQTVEAKIRNQAAVLEKMGKDSRPLTQLACQVRSGDTDNKEGRAARVYWDKLFDGLFTRLRFGDPPNAHLNYAYAILRAVIARALVGSGLNPALGIHHHNRYNMYALADDIMEPYRPFADRVVFGIMEKDVNMDPELSPEIKRTLLSVAAMDVRMDNERSPLMVAASRTTSSLFECLEGTRRRILYPTFDEV